MRDVPAIIIGEQQTQRKHELKMAGDCMIEQELDEREQALQERKERLALLEQEIAAKEKLVKEKEKAKKQILLRLSPTLWTKLAAWAEEDYRSINGQIEYLLSECVRKHGMKDEK